MTITFADVFTSEHLPGLCESLASQTVIVTDDNVAPLYAERILERIPAHVITIPAGEASKSREMKAHIEDQLFELGCGRDTVLLALGGGVVTDLTGFVAATFCRGIPVVYIPTSLLAMVDAAIGGKTAINTAHGKNTLGTFTQPQAIIIDPNFLQTLPDAEYFPAFAEIIKHALIYDKTYFEFIEQNIEQISSRDSTVLRQLIQTSCDIKTTVVSKDQTEQNIREILNFGHTIGHAIEHVSEYQISHGLAVGFGIIAEAYLSHLTGHLNQTELEQITQLVKQLIIQNQTLSGYSEAMIMQALQFDKKSRNKQVRCVLLTKIGKVLCTNESYAHTIASDQIAKAIHLLELH